MRTRRDDDLRRRGRPGESVPNNDGASALLARVEAGVRERGGDPSKPESTFTCPESAHHANGDAHKSARWNSKKKAWWCPVCNFGGGYVDLAKRLGIELPRSDGTRERERVWPLRDAAGAVVAEHVRVDRPGGKRMWWRRPDGRGGLGGLRTSDLPLYGSERLADVDAAALVVVAEGEHATDALLARGIVPAVGTVTGASGTPTDDVLRVLTGRDVVVWTDADDPGRAHMQRIAARLAALGIAVRWYDPAPDATDGQDAADCALSADALRAALAAAAVWQPAADVAPDDAPVGILLADVEPEAVDWLWHGRLARGKLSILEGRPDEGKTTMALDLAARVSTGAPMPGETTRRSPAGVVIVTAEDGLADTIRPRLYASGADLPRCLAARPDESPSLDADGLVWLRRACARVGAALVILDPLVAMMPGAVDAHRDQDIRRMLRPIRALAEELNVAILAIRHLRKAAASSPTDAGGGSVGIGAAARVVMLAAGDPGNAERHVLARVKSNLSAPWPSLSYRLAPTAGTVAVEWGDEVPHTAETLLAAAHAAGAPEEERTRVDEAMDIVRDILADGPMLVADIRKHLRGAGIGEKAADTARARLGVRVKRDGFGGPWQWHPSSSANTAENAENGKEGVLDGQKSERTFHSPQGPHSPQSFHSPTGRAENGAEDGGVGDRLAVRGVLLSYASRAGYPPLALRQGVNVPAGREAWEAFVMHGTAGDVVAATASLEHARGERADEEGTRPRRPDALDDGNPF